MKSMECIFGGIHDVEYLARFKSVTTVCWESSSKLKNEEESLSSYLLTVTKAVYLLATSVIYRTYKTVWLM